MIHPKSLRIDLHLRYPQGLCDRAYAYWDAGAHFMARATAALRAVGANRGAFD